MKNPIFILAILFYIILIAVIVVGSQELRDMVRLKQSEINGLKKANKIERDSLQSLLKVTKDSLQIAFETIKTARKESIEARERTQATIRNLQKIIFIQHTDSSRTAELKTLYKSFNP